MKRFIPVIIALGLALLPGCDTTSPTQATNPTPSSTVTPTPTPTPEGFTFTSSAFQNGGEIPPRYAFNVNEGWENVSIPLHWGTPPSGTKSFALLMTDKSLGNNTYVHWAVIDIPASVNDLPAGAASSESMPGKMLASTGTGQNQYEGPHPPEPHDYQIVLYALDVDTLNFTPGETSALATDLRTALASHVLGQVELIGKFTPPEAYVLTSSAFGNGCPIPASYVAVDGNHAGYLNQSIPLHWGQPPSTAKSFALLMDAFQSYSDATSSIHWAAINIPANVRDISAGASGTANMKGTEVSLFDGTALSNSSYRGPTPGESWTYRITLYALDVDQITLSTNNAGQYTLDSFKAQVSAHQVGYPISLFSSYFDPNTPAN